MKAELKNIIDSIFPLHNASFNKISEIVSYRKVENGKVFLEKGRRNRGEYFLINGVCRSFLLSPDGEEITISFFKTGSI